MSKISLISIKGILYINYDKSNKCSMPLTTSATHEKKFTPDEINQYLSGHLIRNDVKELCWIKCFLDCPAKNWMLKKLSKKGG